MRLYHVYILANRHRTVLYTGVTNNICRRVAEHSSGTGGVFTRKYNVHYLLFAEPFADVHDAIAREKQIKRWSRKKKLKLIKRSNPKLDFLDPIAEVGW